MGGVPALTDVFAWVLWNRDNRHEAFSSRQQSSLLGMKTRVIIAAASYCFALMLVGWWLLRPLNWHLRSLSTARHDGFRLWLAGKTAEELSSSLKAFASIHLAELAGGH